MFGTPSEEDNMWIVLNLQVDEHGYVEEEGADGDGGDVHGQVAPPRNRPQVDAVPERCKLLETTHLICELMYSTGWAKWS